MKHTAKDICRNNALPWIATGLAGASVICGGCSYAKGDAHSEPQTISLRAEPNLTQSRPSLPPSSGDAELDELRRLALEAPIEELAHNWLYFLDSFGKSYRTDEYLPSGLGRFARHILKTPNLPERAMKRAATLPCIRFAEPFVQKQLAAERIALQNDQ
ncbi:MAG: hypothetical protein AB8H80_18390 [Planctomycetota bacterium]